MSKNESFPKNMKIKKLDTSGLRKVNIKKIKSSNNKKKDSNSFAKALKFYKDNNQDSIIKTINENPRRKSNNSKINSNTNLSKKLNNYKSNIKEHKFTKINIKKEKIEEIKLNSKRNSSKKDRYLNCFENSISSKNEENKINALLNDFTISSGNKNKENINIHSNLQSKNNNITNYLIKVNKNNNFQTKSGYIEACEKLKEKLKNNIKNEDPKIIEKEPRKAHVFKISSKKLDRKRNTTGFIKKRFNKKNSSIEESNNSIFKNNCISIDKAKKLYNSFRLNQKQLFLKTNHLNKNKKNIISYNRIITENNKLKNTAGFQFQDKSKIKEKILTEIPPIMNYEQRKIKVIKNKSKSKSPNKFLINDIKDKNLTMQVEKNKINREKIKNINSSIKEELFKSLSFKKEHNCHSMNNSKNYYGHFSLDHSLKNKSEKIEMNKRDQIIILSPVNTGRSNHKRVFSLKKKRYLQKLSRKNLQTENFDFEELNRRLFKMIRNLENHEVKKEGLKLSKTKRDEEGFIKWDIFEKVIKDN